MVCALNQLTQRSDLHLLTLHDGWEFVIYRASSPRLAGVPICYTEWQEQEVCIYQPLCVVQGGDTLPKHHRFLRAAVPIVRTTVGDRAQNSPWHCTQCGQWLGSFPDGKTAAETPEDLISWHDGHPSVGEFRVARAQDLFMAMVFYHLGQEVILVPQ